MCLVVGVDAPVFSHGTGRISVASGSDAVVVAPMAGSENNTITTAGACAGATDGVHGATALLVAQVLGMATARVVCDGDAVAGPSKGTSDRALHNAGGTDHWNLIRKVEAGVAAHALDITIGRAGGVDGTGAASAGAYIFGAAAGVRAVCVLRGAMVSVCALDSGTRQAVDGFVVGSFVAGGERVRVRIGGASAFRAVDTSAKPGDVGELTPSNSAVLFRYARRQ